jgi:hypothetical protein
VNIPVDASMIEYVCGKNDSNLRYLEERSRVISVEVDPTKEGNYILKVTGNLATINEFKFLINTHIDFKEQYLKY